MENHNEMSTEEEYLQLLNLTYEVAQSLKGKSVSDPRWPDCQNLALKLFTHAASIYWLSKGTKSPVPYSLKEGASFFDFGSVVVLARAVLETYITMFEVYFMPKTEDEFEYNYSLWMLSGLVLREDYEPSDPEYKKKYEEAKKEIEGFRDRIISTNIYKSLSTPQQKEVLRGKRKRDWKRLASEAKFGEKSIRKWYSFYSEYVHAGGLSGIQLKSAQNKRDQIEFIDSQMRTVMIVLSKMILEYANKFPEAKSVCEKYTKVYERTCIWSTVAGKLP